MTVSERPVSAETGAVPDSEASATSISMMSFATSLAVLSGASAVSKALEVSEAVSGAAREGWSRDVTSSRGYISHWRRLPPG